MSRVGRIGSIYVTLDDTKRHIGQEPILQALGDLSLAEPTGGQYYGAQNHQVLNQTCRWSSSSVEVSMKRVRLVICGAIVLFGSSSGAYHTAWAAQSVAVDSVGTNIAASDAGGHIERMTGEFGPGHTGRLLIDGRAEPVWTLTGKPIRFPQEIVVSFYER